MPDSSISNGLATVDRVGDGRPVGYGVSDGSTVTQATSVVTAVTLDKPSGTITTFASTSATLVDFTFTVNNSTVGEFDTPIVVVKSYGGTADGIPIASVSAVADGSFTVNVMNNGAVTLDAVIVLSMNIIKGSAS